MAVPPELAKALKANATARRAWDALSYSHRREHAEAVAEAKKPETRARRIEKTLAMLTTTGKPARPAPSAKPLATRLHIKPGMKVAVLSAPRGFSLGVPSSPATKGAHVVLLFAASRSALKTWIPKIKDLAESAALWIAYPKTTSGKKTTGRRFRCERNFV